MVESETFKNESVSSTVSLGAPRTDAESSVVSSEGGAESVGNSSEFGLEPRNGLVPMERNTWPSLCHDTRRVRTLLPYKGFVTAVI